MGNKTNLELVQEVVEAKLNNLDNKIDINNRNLAEKIDTNNKHILELLSRIEQQTIKTNGNVIRHDREIHDISNIINSHILTSLTNDDINKKLSDFDKKIEIINEENFIVRIFNKYPKALVTGLVILVISGILSLGYTVIIAHNTYQDMKKVEKIEVDK